MTSEKNSFHEQFTGESSSSESSLNTGSTASSRAHTLPSIVGLYPPTNQSSTEINDSQSARLLNGSCHQYSAIGVPVPANGRTIGPEETIEQMAVERLTNACCTLLDKYKRAVIYFRSTCYILILHFLITYIPIASILVGWIYSKECPLSSFLPMFVMVVGIVGFLFMGFGITVSCCEFHVTPCSRLQKYAVGTLFVLLLLLVTAEMYLVNQLSPNFNAYAEDYCNQTFYYYVIGKEIASVAAIIIAALIYLPGSSLHTCCPNVPAPSPASAFFSSL